MGNDVRRIYCDDTVLTAAAGEDPEYAYQARDIIKGLADDTVCIPPVALSSAFKSIVGYHDIADPLGALVQLLKEIDPEYPLPAMPPDTLDIRENLRKDDKLDELSVQILTQVLADPKTRTFYTLSEPRLSSSAVSTLIRNRHPGMRVYDGYKP